MIQTNRPTLVRRCSFIVWLIALYIAPDCKETASNAEDLVLVQKVFAEILTIEPSAVAAHKTIAELQADDLDFIEAVMEIEQRADINIPDKAIEDACNSRELKLDRITIGQLADIVNAIRKAM